MIEIKNLNKSFTSKSETFHALKNINLELSKGETTIIKGASGSGKSTLLSIIASIMKPTSGKVNIEGENIVSYSDTHASEYRRDRVGFITQTFHLFDELSVYENLLAPLLAREDVKYFQLKELITVALTTANIAHKLNQKVSTLSGGERQRVIIARAIINNPDIIICDEPTASLDYENALSFIATLKKLKDMGKTIIISTHDQLFENLDFVDKVYSIRDGSLE